MIWIAPIINSLNIEKSNNVVYLQCIIVDKTLVKKKLIAKVRWKIYFYYIFSSLFPGYAVQRGDKARACNSEIDVRTELPSFCWHKWIYVAPSISHMASLWWHAIRVSPLETYSAASFAVSPLLSRRYSVFGKLLKHGHKSVVDGDPRSGNIFESSRGQSPDVYSAAIENNARKTKGKLEAPIWNC